MTKLVRRGVATRLRPGLFVLVPPEMGRAADYAGNPYVIARELAGGRDYFLSHASAMDIHRMTTQPQLVVFVTTRRPVRPRRVMGMEFRFVEAGRGGFFGATDYWAEKQEKVRVATIERTVIDGLRRPGYCGGIAEVAKGLWLRRGDAAAGRLVEYALRLGSGAVLRRLGFLLEQYGLASPRRIERLRRNLTASYALFDPLLPAEGRFVARWRLRLNVTPAELAAVVGT
jgi:predicted transcriptional regulator of viral defense system